MTKMPTHYDNLQVTENASIEEIKVAYKYLSQRWHPDKNPDQREQAERITGIINQAYAVLSDPVRRKAHDKWIAAQRAEERKTSTGHNNSTQGRWTQSTSSETPNKSRQSGLRAGFVLIGFVVIGILYSISTTEPAPRPTPQPTTIRFQVHGSNHDIIKDTTTGLYWMRCSVGQIWNGRTCTGEASRHNWDQARQIGHSGWRLPTREELQTLVYCSNGQPGYFPNSACSGGYQRPTIVTEAFPNTPSDAFWSASHCAGASDCAWFVFFSTGRDRYWVKSYHSRVRLVRDGQ